jgi:hypothetical protein
MRTQVGDERGQIRGAVSWSSNIISLWHPEILSRSSHPSERFYGVCEWDPIKILLLSNILMVSPLDDSMAGSRTTEIPFVFYPSVLRSGLELE